MSGPDHDAGSVVVTRMLSERSNGRSEGDAAHSSAETTGGVTGKTGIRGTDEQNGPEQGCCGTTGMGFSPVAEVVELS
jgi:hypothetical protein